MSADPEVEFTPHAAATPGVPLQELESRLCAAANSLRGPVDAADFKAYIFPILFLKRICDAWTEEHHRAVEDYGDELNDVIESGAR